MRRSCLCDLKRTAVTALLVLATVGMAASDLNFDFGQGQSCVAALVDSRRLIESLYLRSAKKSHRDRHLFGFFPAAVPASGPFSPPGFAESFPLSPRLNADPSNSNDNAIVLLDHLADPAEKVGVFLSGDADLPSSSKSVARNLSLQFVPTGAKDLTGLRCSVDSDAPTPGILGRGSMEITGAPRDGGSLSLPRHLNVDELEAAKYYDLIDPPRGDPPEGKRTHLKEFLLVNKFGRMAGDRFQMDPKVISAYYVNAADLGFGRSMHMRKRSNGDIAFYVRNFFTVEEAIAERGNPLAEVGLGSVAMEYSPIDPQDPACAPHCARVTKFYVFDGDNVRDTSADLDRRDRFEGTRRLLPGLCTACHGGNHFSAGDPASPPDPDLKARFIPFDVESFGFADQDHFRRGDQESAFRKMNLAILTHTEPAPATKELVCGWYGPEGTPPRDCEPAHLTRQRQRREFVPEGWRAHEADRDLYRDVVKRSCRACHLQRDASLDFSDALQFRAWKDTIYDVACRGAFEGDTLQLRAPYMPHSRWTFLNFWLNPSPHRNPATGQVELWHQPAVLQEALEFDKRCTPRAKRGGIQGDLNGDGRVDEEDEPLLSAVVDDYFRTFKSRAIYTYPNPFDRNQDGTLTHADAR